MKKKSMKGGMPTAAELKAVSGKSSKMGGLPSAADLKAVSGKGKGKKGY